MEYPTSFNRKEMYKGKQREKLSGNQKKEKIDLAKRKLVTRYLPALGIALFGTGAIMKFAGTRIENKRDSLEEEPVNSNSKEKIVEKKESADHSDVEERNGIVEEKPRKKKSIDDEKKVEKSQEELKKEWDEIHKTDPETVAEESGVDMVDEPKSDGGEGESGIAEDGQEKGYDDVNPIEGVKTKKRQEGMGEKKGKKEKKNERAKKVEVEIPKNFEKLYHEQEAHRKNIIKAAERIVLDKIKDASILKRTMEYRPGVIKSIFRKYGRFIRHFSKKFKVEPVLVACIIAVESDGNLRARPIGNDGKAISSAKGLMQLIDSTAEAMGVKNPYNPKENIMGGTKYLRIQFDDFEKDWALALKSYKDGPRNLRKLLAKNSNYDPANKNMYTKEVLLLYKTLNS